MPNRIIKEDIRTDKKVNELSDFEFRLWAYLITYVDDFGRGSADTAILKGFVFPLRKAATEKSIGDALSTLERIGLVNLYEVGGEPYLYFPKWGKHQRIQTKQSKFPEPPSSTVSHGESPLESNPIQYESESNNMSELYGRIIAYLNKKTGKHFKVGEEVKRLIKARFNAGASEEDFYTVIDNKCAKWLNDPKMNEYLRPITLFSSKFDSYLNDIPPEERLPIYDPSGNMELSREEEDELLRMMKGEQCQTQDRP